MDDACSELTNELAAGGGGAEESTREAFLRQQGEEPRGRRSGEDEEEEDAGVAAAAPPAPGAAGISDMERQLREFEEAEAMMQSESQLSLEEAAAAASAAAPAAAAAAGSAAASAAAARPAQPAPAVSKVQAHCPGRCGLALLPVGGGAGGLPEVATCGPEGFVKLFLEASLSRGGEDAEQPRVEIALNSAVLSVAGVPGRAQLITGEADGAVRLLDAEGGQLQELVCRLPGPAREVAVSADGALVAVATSEHTVKVVDLRELSRAWELKGHKGPVRSVAWCSALPLALLASSGADGAVKVWSAPTGQCLHTLPDALRVDRTDNVNDKQAGRLAWAPHAALLAVPGKAGVVLLRFRAGAGAGAGLEAAVLDGPAAELTLPAALEGPVTCVAWSPNGRYVAAGGEQGELVVWDVVTSVVVADLSGELGHAASAQALRWLPERNELAVALMDGDLVVLRQVVPATLPRPGAAEPGAAAATGAAATLPHDTTAVEINHQGAEAESESEGEGEGEDEDVDEPAGAAGGTHSQAVAPGGAGAGAGTSRAQVEAIVQQLLAKRLAALPARQRAFQPAATLRSVSSLDISAEEEALEDSEGEGRAYLAWNATGAIVSRREPESGFNAVEVEFANAQLRALRFNDNVNLQLAALSETGAVFASRGSFVAQAEGEAGTYLLPQPPPDGARDEEDWDPRETARSRAAQQRGAAEIVPGADGSFLRAALEMAERVEAGEVDARAAAGGRAADDWDEDVAPEGEDPEAAEARERARRARLLRAEREAYGEASTVMFKPFNLGWASAGAEWSLRLPAKEKARCVAAGLGFCAVATSRRALRVIRASGLQEAPLLLPGPVLALSAAPAATLLLAVFHSAEPAENGSQRLGFQLWDVGAEEGAGRTGRGLRALVAQGPLPVPAREARPLRWLGFADASAGHMPLALDSKGALLGLSRAAHWGWVPLLDTHALRLPGGLGSAVFPVSVQRGQLIACVLRAGQRAPATVPRPVLKGFAIRVPLLGLEDATGTLKFQLESEALSHAVAFEQARWAQREHRLAQLAPQQREPLEEEEARLDAKLIKHLVLSIKLQRPTRALGVLRRLRLVRSVQIAIAQAQRAQADAALLERMEQVLKLREREAEQDASEDDSSDSSEEDQDEQESQGGEERATVARRLAAEAAAVKAKRAAAAGSAAAAAAVAKRSRADSGSGSEYGANGAASGSPSPVNANRKRLSAASRGAQDQKQASSRASSGSEEEEEEEEEEEDGDEQAKPAAKVAFSFRNPFAVQADAADKDGKPDDKDKKKRAGSQQAKLSAFGIKTNPSTEQLALEAAAAKRRKV